MAKYLFSKASMKSEKDSRLYNSIQASYPLQLKKKIQNKTKPRQKKHTHIHTHTKSIESTHTPTLQFMFKIVTKLHTPPQ